MADLPHAPLDHRPMHQSDLTAVHALEIRSYEFPWTQGIFRDCLASDYPARVVEENGAIVGYFMLSIAASEAHILNICIAPELQGRGHGRALLHVLLQVARARRVQRVFLEVRPTNLPAIALYHDEGFNEIGRRPRYYPARKGREDGLVMALELITGD